MRKLILEEWLFSNTLREAPWGTWRSAKVVRGDALAEIGRLKQAGKHMVLWGSSTNGLLQLHREMQVGYCRLVTISTDNLLETNEFRAGVGAQWTFLSDPGRRVQKDLDIAEYTDPHHNPMIPHTVVLEPGLRVYKIYNGYWFFGRPTVEELRLDLRAVLQRCRPDWDISSTAQRTAWANGDKARFYPYGKTQAQVLAERD